MTRYQYVARLIPIRKQLEVVDRSEGRIVEWFDETCSPSSASTPTASPSSSTTTSPGSPDGSTRSSSTAAG